MPTLNLFGSTTPSDILTASAAASGQVFDSIYLFVAFAAGLGIAVWLGRIVIGLIRHGTGGRK